VAAVVPFHDERASGLEPLWGIGLLELLYRMPAVVVA